MKERTKKIACCSLASIGILGLSSLDLNIAYGASLASPANAQVVKQKGNLPNLTTELRQVSNVTTNNGLTVKAVEIYHAQTFKRVYNSYSKPFFTGQTLSPKTNWLVLKKARDKNGKLWYKLGRDQWVTASTREDLQEIIDHQEDKIARPIELTKSLIVINDLKYPHYLTIQTQANQIRKYMVQPNKYTYPVVVLKKAKTHQKPTYSTKLSHEEQKAKNYIATHQSGNDYNASIKTRDNQLEFYGKYLIEKTLFQGDLSPFNQERVADKYVKDSYGSWQNAVKFYKQNHCF